MNKKTIFAFLSIIGLVVFAYLFTMNDLQSGTSAQNKGANSTNSSEEDKNKEQMEVQEKEPEATEEEYEHISLEVLETWLHLLYGSDAPTEEILAYLDIDFYTEEEWEDIRQSLDYRDPPLRVLDMNFYGCSNFEEEEESTIEESCWIQTYERMEGAYGAMGNYHVLKKEGKDQWVIHPNPHRE